MNNKTQTFVKSSEIRLDIQDASTVTQRNDKKAFKTISVEGRLLKRVRRCALQLLLSKRAACWPLPTLNHLNDIYS